MKYATYSLLLVAVTLLLSAGHPALGSVVAQWDFDTKSGTPVTDGQSALGQVDGSDGYAGGPFNGTGYGGTLSYQSGAVGSNSHSLEFTEGVSPIDYVGLSMPTAIAEITKGAFTVETWFKTEDHGRGVLVGTYHGSIQDDLNFEINSSGQIRGHIGSPTAVTDFSSSGHADVADGKWHHGAFVRESVGGNVLLYLDGVEVGRSTDASGSFTLSTSSTLYLGRDYRTDSTRFDGYLDNTRISNTALMPNQFHIYAEQNYYRMETDDGVAVSAGQAASVVDDTGTHAVTYNGDAHPSSSLPSYSSDVAGSVILHDGVSISNNHSLSFSGNGDYVELDNQPLLTTLTEGDFTIEFFLKTPKRDSRAVVLGTYDGDTSYILNLEIGGATHGDNQGHLRPFLQSDGAFDQFFGLTNISDNKWHHVAMVRSGAGTGSDWIQLFVDYELDGQMSLGTGQYTLRPEFFRLGRDSRGSGFYYQGLLDEFRITREALSVNQFLQAAVPEPSSLILWGLGAVGLLCLRRRRTR